MENRNIIVVGGSTGGMEAFTTIVAGLPPDFAAAIFMVWHIGPDAQGTIPRSLNRLQSLPVANAIDKEPIRMGRIYMAPPDRHLLVEKGRVRVTRGPKENRFRPAIDPLFRSAAQAYGARVIGVVLSGALDDGTAGLWTIKQWGGIAIVQDPVDALVSSMPGSALEAVTVDYITPAAGIAPLLVQLVEESAIAISRPGGSEGEKTKREVNVALGFNALKNNVMDLGILSPYTCPECHGALTALRDGDIERFRCHTGHAFSANSLLAAITENSEAYLWNAIRNVQESVILLNHLGDHLAEANQPKLAAAYFKKAKEAAERVRLMSEVVFTNEALDSDRLEEQALDKDDDGTA